MFQNNAFPVILFCCTNCKDIPAELKRMFLEIFQIDSPDDTERELMLEWILRKNDIDLGVGVNLKSVASKTNGFYFEDLAALVYYAENNFYKSTRRCPKIALDNDDLAKAIGKSVVSSWIIHLDLFCLRLYAFELQWEPGGSKGTQSPVVGCRRAK